MAKRLPNPRTASTPASSPTLTRRELNRATLARQMLLKREALAVVPAVERLVGLQAQEPRPPFIGLWSRLEEGSRADIAAQVHRRTLVRAAAFRCTLHLMTSADFRRFRTALQPAMTASLKSVAQQRGRAQIDIERTVAIAHTFLARQPNTMDALREHLAEHFPNLDTRALGYAVRMHLPLVQVPTDAEWAFDSISKFTPAVSWLKAELDTEVESATDALVLRYLAAFGPASVADAQAWSGLRGLKANLARLRPQLAVFRDEAGVELFDLPDAPRPPADTAAPVRFLPEFDNVILAHADRTRIITEAQRKAVVTKNLRVLATALVDGEVAATWSIEHTRSTSTLVVHPFKPLAAKVAKALTAEGERLVRFVEPEAAAIAVKILPSR